MKATIDFSDNERLLEALRKVPHNIEDKLNTFLGSTGANLVKDKIIENMPISAMDRAHAKTSKSLRHKMQHLGFTVSPYPKFGYLVFPNDGIGKRNPVAQQFFEIGVEQAENPLLEQVLDIIEEEI